MDESLIDPGYAGSRKAKTIGPLEIRIVEKGSFGKILDHYLNLGATPSVRIMRYKTGLVFDGLCTVY
ncbi:hypothetical protein SUGI_0732490 [Cryptomeria japonica]|nr:hypothetical protein SUGI_0732490 [Cryptomeria japonica]